MIITALFCIPLKCYKIQDNQTQAVLPTRRCRAHLEKLWRAGIAGPPSGFSQVKGPPIHQRLSLRMHDFEGIFSPVQISKPLQSMTNSGTYGAIFLASLILCYIYCRLVCCVYTHTYANSNYLFNTHMCIHSSLDFTRLTSCR